MSAQVSRSQPNSEREEWMQLVRNEYDPAPTHYRMGDDWDDGAGRIADAILADKLLLLRKITELEARVAILDFCSSRIDCLVRGEAMKQKDGS